jgi:D-3-phosphoglycerate dehydrogenase
MTLPVYLADPEVHASVVESLSAEDSGLRCEASPHGVAALITQDVDVGTDLLDAAGEALEAIVLLEPASAAVATTQVPIHRIDNPALTGVAEHTVLLMLSLAKRLPWVLQQTRNRDWAPGTSPPILTSQRDYTYNWVGLDRFGMLAGSTVGLVGLGTIGRATARLLRGFAANVIYTKRTRLPADEEAGLGVSYRDLDRLLRESDFVSLHHRFVAGEAGNDREFGPDAFRRMKPSAFFVNTARGRMVDEDALCHAIATGEIAGAALDVFRHEPLPDDHPFFDLPADRLILTPHLAGVPMKDAAASVVRQIGALLRAGLDAGRSEPGLH